MEVILLKDVEKLGKQGERVDVRDGYGHNYLLPRQLAARATRQNKLWIEQEKNRAAERSNREKQETENLAAKIGQTKLRLEVAVGEKNKLFGSVTSQNLAEALQKEGVSVDRKQFHLPEPLRSLGLHDVPVELGHGIKATLQVELVKKS